MKIEIVQGTIILGDITGLVPDDHNKLSVPMKEIIMLLPMEGIAFIMVKNATSMKPNKMRYACNRNNHWEKLQLF